MTELPWCHIGGLLGAIGSWRHQVIKSKSHALFAETLAFAEGLAQNRQYHLVFRAPRCGFDFD